MKRRGRSGRALAREWTLCFGFAAMLVTSGAPLVAQQDAGAVADTIRASRQPLFVPRDAIFGAGVIAGTLALAPLDRWAADQFQDPNRQGNKFLRETATGFRLLGNPGVIIVSAGMYLTGRVADRPNLADVGLHVGESIAAAGIATDLIKVLAGRARPETNPDSPHSFQFARGWSEEGDRSFPSGHTSAAFAAAASISTEVGRLYPKAHVWVRPILYGAACFSCTVPLAVILSAAKDPIVAGREVAGTRERRESAAPDHSPRRDPFAALRMTNGLATGDWQLATGNWRPPPQNLHTNTTPLFTGSTAT